MIFFTTLFLFSEAAADLWKLEGRVLYFSPANKATRNFYGAGFGEIHLQGCYRYCDPWEAFLDIGYGSRSGRVSEVSHESYKMRLYPFTVGLRYIYPFCENLQLNGAFGVNYSLLRQVNRYDSGNRYVSKNAFGAVAEVGAKYLIWKSFFADLFLGYRFLKFSSWRDDAGSSHPANFSGLSAGGGLGFTF